MNTGLVSVSFRHLSPEEVVKAAAAAGFKHIEWGSDVHAPWDDGARLEEIVRLQERYGVSCCWNSCPMMMWHPCKQRQILGR